MIVLIGLAGLTFLLVEPHFEGRNAHATLFEVYFKDPFLAFVYLGSTSFFAALYQAFKVVGFIAQDKASSQETVKALRLIRYCAFALVGFVAVGEIFIVLNESDDRAGGVFMGILVTFGAAVVAIGAAKFERTTRK